jgi:hypothetical protein
MVDGLWMMVDVKLPSIIPQPSYIKHNFLLFLCQQMRCFYELSPPWRLPLRFKR